MKIDRLTMRAAAKHRTPLVKTIRVTIGTEFERFALRMEALIDRKEAIQRVTKLRDIAKEVLRSAALPPQPEAFAQCSFEFETPAVRSDEFGDCFSWQPFGEGLELEFPGFGTGKDGWLDVEVPLSGRRAIHSC